VRYASPASFDAPYGDSGRVGVDSSEGSGTPSPSTGGALYGDRKSVV